MNHLYEDIINLPHKEPYNHKRMTIEERSAQFAPFAALTGYKEEINEASRITDQKIELSIDQKIELDQKLQNINNSIQEKKSITFTYFIKDKNKKGGYYINVTGNIKKIDKINEEIILENRIKIPIKDIIEINIPS